MPVDFDVARLALLYRWLSYCIHRHPACSKRELEYVYPDRVEIILIDVKQMCLVHGATDDGYLALSYVWGQITQFHTLVSNLETLLLPDWLREVESQIPNVIRDAIQLTRSLGETYPWVDALCIVQDDLVFKQRQLSLMAEIYNSATATIIAYSGSDAQVHLFDKTPGALPLAEMDQVDASFCYLPIRLKGSDAYHYQCETGIRRPFTPKTELEKIAK